MGIKYKAGVLQTICRGRDTITLNIAAFKFKLGNFDEATRYTFACRVVKSENIVTWEY